MLLRSFPALFDHYGYYNPTHSFRELDSAGGLQTSRPMWAGRREREPGGKALTCLLRQVINRRSRHGGDSVPNEPFGHKMIEGLFVL